MYSLLRKMKYFVDFKFLKQSKWLEQNNGLIIKIGYAGPDYISLFSKHQECFMVLFFKENSFEIEIPQHNKKPVIISLDKDLVINIEDYIDTELILMTGRKTTDNQIISQINSNDIIFDKDEINLEKLKFIFDKIIELNSPDIDWDRMINF